jgi:hypothetical protein
MDVRKLRLRYAGTCVACGAALPQGVQALYREGEPEAARVAVIGLPRLS